MTLDSSELYALVPYRFWDVIHLYKSRSERNEKHRGGDNPTLTVIPPMIKVEVTNETVT